MQLESSPLEPTTGKNPCPCDHPIALHITDAIMQLVVTDMQPMLLSNGRDFEGLFKGVTYGTKFPLRIIFSKISTTTDGIELEELERG